MSFVIKKRTLLIIAFALILLLSAYMMFLGNFPKVVYEKQLDSGELEKVSISAIDDTQEISAVANLENDFFIEYKLERDRLRGQEADYLRELINNPNASTESKEKISMHIV